MKKTIILITCGYPFGKSEPFIENEISFMSKNFDRILIIAPTDLKNRTRDIPQNAELITIINKFNKIKNCILGCGYIFNNSESWKLAKTIYKPTLKRKLYFSYISALADRYYRMVKKELIKYSFEKDEKVIIYSYWLNYLSNIAIKINKDFFSDKATVVSRSHRADLYDEVAPFQMSPLKKYAIKYLDAIYACSQEGANYLKKKYYEYESKIKYSYLGTNDCGLNSSNKLNNFFCIVSCSSIYSVKRVDLIIKSLAFITTKKIVWHHIGSGELYDNVVDLAKKTLPQNIEFIFDGQMQNVDIMEFYKNNHVDLFINLSESEGIPVSIMEAMSFGIPVLATNVGGVPELVSDAVGKIIEVNSSADSIADSINSFLESDEDKTLEYRTEARKKWQESFNAAINYEKFYNEIANLSKTSTSK